jgi:cystathionine beta-lyase/cystathionine gamma-synthase
MTHASAAESPLGVRPDLVRRSVGFEDVADSKADVLYAPVWPAVLTRN